MIYNGITRTWWTAIQAALQAETGVQVNTDADAVTHEVRAAFLRGNITIKWDYDEHGQTLMVDCTAKPAWLPEGKIDNELTALVNAAKPQEGK